MMYERYGRLKIIFLLISYQDYTYMHTYVVITSTNCENLFSVNILIDTCISSNTSIIIIGSVFLGLLINYFHYFRSNAVKFFTENNFVRAKRIIMEKNRPESFVFYYGGEKGF